ncbi:hypothetical protein [Leptospira interrogans]|uniref:hypothetical protein n=1 Tax=Leptospira interrogans TaxID=173 RepID=UPI0007733553|nr:hypothetical protein [Leptospira interrogans]
MFLQVLHRNGVSFTFERTVKLCKFLSRIFTGRIDFESSQSDSTNTSSEIINHGISLFEINRNIPDTGYCRYLSGQYFVL